MLVSPSLSEYAVGCGRCWSEGLGEVRSVNPMDGEDAGVYGSRDRGMLWLLVYKPIFNAMVVAKGWI